LFTVVPAVEIYLLFKIGGSIGAFNTVFIVIITGIVGASLAKSQGLSILMKIQGELNKGGMPANQIIHGLMVFAGGLLLLTPGFMTDIFGLSLVLPGTRHVLMVFVKKMIEEAMKNGNFNFQTFGQTGGFEHPQTHESHTQYETESQPQSHLDGDVFEADFTKKE